MRTIYKICSAAQWREAEALGFFPGAAIDEADGFIHFSTGAQVVETAEKHFGGQDGLLLVAVNSDALNGLRWEPSRGGALFPHLYGGPLPFSAVEWTKPLPLGADGRHSFPPLAP